MRIFPLVLLLSVAFSKADNLSVLLPKAEKGDVDAQYQLAEIYAEAQGVDQDYSKASQWARKAADQGNPKAQYRLASILFYGMDGKKNQPEALQLFIKSAAGLERLSKKNDADAQSKLGILYAQGIGVKNDQKEAVKLFEKAAKAGVLKAQCDLGDAYLFGRGVERNPTIGGEWYEKAAGAGYGKAQIQFGLINIQGMGCRQDIKEGLDWLKRASEQRHPEYAKQAKDLLDRLEKNPPVNGPDMDALIERAGKGELKAQLDLANRYEKGAGLKVDYQAVLRWLDAAARQGSPSASHQLGGILMAGRGGAKNPEKAVQYWHLAASLGSRVAQVDYAVACAKGYGMQKNLSDAYYWTLIARKTAVSEEQQNSLRTLQRLISDGLKSDDILKCLKRSRIWKNPKDHKTRIQIVGAEYGKPEMQFARGLAIKDSHPVEALKWLRLAEKAKVKGAGKSAVELAEKLSKFQVERAEIKAGSFNPLGG